MSVDPNRLAEVVTAVRAVGDQLDAAARAGDGPGMTAVARSVRAAGWPEDLVQDVLDTGVAVTRGAL